MSVFARGASVRIVDELWNNSALPTNLDTRYGTVLGLTDDIQGYEVELGDVVLEMTANEIEHC